MRWLRKLLKLHESGVKENMCTNNLVSLDEWVGMAITWAYQPISTADSIYLSQLCNIITSIFIQLMLQAGFMSPKCDVIIKMIILSKFNSN